MLGVVGMVGDSPCPKELPIQTDRRWEGKQRQNDLPKVTARARMRTQLS